MFRMKVRVEALITNMEIGKKKIAFMANINTLTLPISPAQYEAVERFLKKKYPKSEVYIIRVSEA